MNQRIANLEKRKNRIVKCRNQFKWNADKEDALFPIIIAKFDRIITMLNSAIRSEWNKTYIAK